MGEGESPPTSMMNGHYPYDRERLQYELTVRQEPKQARMCGVGADRRPIDPPPIIQLRVIDPAASENAARRRVDNAPGPSPESPTSKHGNAANAPDDQNVNQTNPDGSRYALNYLQNPYYFMFASLAKPDDDAELHWLKDGRTRCTTGSVVSSLYHLKDTEHHNEDAGFFVFPDLSVRTEGSYRLKLSLFEVVGNNVCHCKSIYSAPFYVYTAKKFPGMEESTPLSCSLADQGIKIRIRKDIRVRKRPIQALEPLPLPTDQSSVDNEEDADDNNDDARKPNTGLNKRDSKRTRFDRGDNAPLSATDTSGRSEQEHTPWSSATESPTNVTGSGPPPIIPPPPPPGSEQPNVSISLPGPSVYDGRGGGGGYHPYDPPPPVQHSSHGHGGYRSSDPLTPASQVPPPHGQSYGPPHSQSQQYGPPPSQHAPPPLAVPSHMPPPAQPPLQHGAVAPPPQHLPPPVHSVPPPPQSSHIPSTPSHLNHVPPPLHGHHSGPGLSSPAGQPGYTSYTSSWGAPPPPQQAQAYDPYPPHPQHPHMHQHQQHYGPPPSAPQPMHHGPPPPRYDYPGPAYGMPQQQGYNGYYEQMPQQSSQQHPLPPPSYGSNSPRVAPPPLSTPGQQQGSSSATSSVGGSTGYGEYSYSRGSPPSSSRGYQHAHYYGPPPPGAPSSSYPSERYHPHGYHYNYGGPPPQPSDSWGPHSASGHGPQGHTQGYAPWSSEPYGNGGSTTGRGSGDSGYSSSGSGGSVSSGSGGLVGAIGNPRDRIQLAPLRAGHHGNPTSPHLLSLALPGSASGGSGGGGFPVMSVKSNGHGRSGSGGGYSNSSRDSGERERERNGGSRDGERGGKKNPLSIGSIISDETG